MSPAQKTRNEFVEAFMTAAPEDQRTALHALCVLLPYDICRQGANWFRDRIPDHAKPASKG